MPANQGFRSDLSAAVVTVPLMMSYFLSLVFEWGKNTPKSQKNRTATALSKDGLLRREFENKRRVRVHKVNSTRKRGGVSDGFRKATIVSLTDSPRVWNQQNIQFSDLFSNVDYPEVTAVHWAVGTLTGTLK
jgi:hypothetical protein